MQPWSSSLSNASRTFGRLLTNAVGPSSTWTTAHTVEITFLRWGGIDVSFETGEGQPTIHPRLLPWVKRKVPDSPESVTRLFSDLSQHFLNKNPPHPTRTSVTQCTP